MSLHIMGNHHVQVDGDNVVPISKLRTMLQDKQLNDKTTAKVVSRKTTSRQDMVELQNVLRKAGLLRISYQVEPS